MATIDHHPSELPPVDPTDPVDGELYGLLAEFDSPGALVRCSP